MNAVSTALLFVACVLLLVVATRLWSWFKPRRSVVYDYQRGVLYRNGAVEKVVGPGAYWTTIHRQLVLVDTRRQLHQIPGQEILTADGVSVKISAAIEYSVVDAARMLAASNNLIALAYSYAQSALREAVSTLTLEALLPARVAVAQKTEELLRPQLAELGAELYSVRLIDIMLPSDLRRAYAQAMAEQKQGLAALERARSETASLRSLANAARLMQDHPGLLQLRAVQAVEASKGKTSLELRLEEPRGRE